MSVVKEQLLSVFEDAFQHNGFSEFRVEIKILKRQQKEVIIHYGKQHRFVMDYMNFSRSTGKTKASPSQKLVNIKP
ncbi:MAG: hypothetical protein HND53_00195 [Proteobacteria bacterium]|nr:hypothetical protein [Pseudomonadota bacterium]NOG58894.1 hypothetical protein [Pseudomonadota bacterium]